MAKIIMSEMRTVLEAVSRGEIEIDAAMTQLRGYEDLGHSRVDISRAARNGVPEVVYGAGKRPEHLLDILGSLQQHGNDILVTRLEPEVAAQVASVYPEAEYHTVSRLLKLQRQAPVPVAHTIAVVCAGTSDLPVAEEACVTAEFYGNPVLRVFDAGVAGLHRLLDSIEAIRACRVVVVVAGMEGALPSVVGGLVSAPVIAVPTSVGYGANFGGLSALLGMLNSCASGMSVVNIDNGFGAGFLANRINRL
jgi:NCAIR mutase (PurE)-related protein